MSVETTHKTKFMHYHMPVQYCRKTYFDIRPKMIRGFALINNERKSISQLIYFKIYDRTKIRMIICLLYLQCFHSLVHLFSLFSIGQDQYNMICIRLYPIIHRRSGFVWSWNCLSCCSIICTSCEANHCDWNKELKITLDLYKIKYKKRSVSVKISKY